MKIAKYFIIALTVPIAVIGGLFIISAVYIADWLETAAKKLLAIALVVSASCACAQPAIYLQQQVGGESTTFLHMEERVKFAVVQYGLGTDYESGYRGYVRFGFGHTFGDFSAWAYAPWMNFKSGQGYNTPISVEVFYRDAISVQVDGYSNGAVLSLKGRVKIVDFGKKVNILFDKG